MWKDTLKKEWNENPLKVLAVVAYTANAYSRFLNARSLAKTREAYRNSISCSC